MTVPFYKRRGVLVTAGVLAIPVIALAWWLAAPLFQDDVVDEAFPRAAAAEIPDDMTAEDVEKEMEEAEAITVEAEEPMPEPVPAADEPDEEPAGPVMIVSGEVVGADDFHQGSGTATIYRLDDGSHVLRLEDFEVTNGPDLHVILSPVANPTTREEVSAEGYVDLGELKGNVGNQNYDIPPEVDIDSIGSVVIYCVPFHVVFSTATLSG